MDEETLEQTVATALREALNSGVFTGGLMTSLIIIAAVLIARALIVKHIKGHSEILNKDQRIWINRVKNTAISFIVIAMIFIWAPQIQTFALSLTAVAVAVVLITKELLMCLTGGFMRATSKPFQVGDWITADNLHGEVMEINTLSTIIEELDPKTRQYTGRTLHIPNSKFLTATIENANFLKHYLYHTINIAVAFQDVNPVTLQNTLEDIVNKHYSSYQKAAERFNKMVERKTGIDFADAKPEYGVRTTDLGHYIFSVKLFAPTKEFGQLESLIALEFLEHAHAMKVENKEKPKGDKKAD